MTRYFVGANIWFGLAVLLYLGSHRSHWTIPYYQLFGQGQYDSVPYT